MNVGQTFSLPSCDKNNMMTTINRTTMPTSNSFSSVNNHKISKLPLLNNLLHLCVCVCPHYRYVLAGLEDASSLSLAADKFSSISARFSADFVDGASLCSDFTDSGFFI